MARLLASDPSVLLASVEGALEPKVALLRHALGPACTPDLLRKLVTKSSLLSRSLATVQVRRRPAGALLPPPSVRAPPRKIYS